VAAELNFGLGEKTVQLAALPFTQNETSMLDFPTHGIRTKGRGTSRIPSQLVLSSSSGRSIPQCRKAAPSKDFLN